MEDLGVLFDRGGEINRESKKNCSLMLNPIIFFSVFPDTSATSGLFPLTGNLPRKR
ncbi:hypothetical protein IAD21_00416 [Abditibacteriota bacterium]|nr:hypothetical protein IAD21_00416 [Abditibacteriota bacterium]